jgi:hypothetical protein
MTPNTRLDALLPCEYAERYSKETLGHQHQEATQYPAGQEYVVWSLFDGTTL